MQAFTYVKASDPAAASALATRGPQAVSVAGATDLLCRGLKIGREDRSEKTVLAQVPAAVL